MMKLNWLVQSTQAHPDLAGGRIPAGLLTEEEIHLYHSLKAEKRRRDWLLGRWTAKHLLQSILVPAPALNDFSIMKASDGSPSLCLPDYPCLTLSLSHSRDHALGVAVWDGIVGADMEYIEPRSAAFAADYFTRQEQNLLQFVDHPQITANAIWSAKEAVLKALRLGLTVDTRAVECRIATPATPPQDWLPFDITLDPARLKTTPDLMGWWRVWGQYVLTVVIGE